MKETFYLVGYAGAIVFGDEQRDNKKVNWAIPMSLKKAREFHKTGFDRDDQKDARIYKLVEVK